uniref:Prion/Doppel protein beta-ribbon domain-containing protein n=1 Tax=Pelusios castaneus TaxID=367368 RepID=A0A8C8R9V0_9SAUR
MRRKLMVACWVATFLLVLHSDTTLCRRGTSSKKANKNKNPPYVNKPNLSAKEEPLKPSGTLCYTGQLLNVTLEPEDAKYYTHNFKNFPSCIYYPRCFQSPKQNTIKRMLVSECFNNTVSLTELDLSEGKNTTNVNTRVLWHVISHLCAMEFCCNPCSLSLSSHNSVAQLAVLCLTSFIPLTVQ